MAKDNAAMGSIVDPNLLDKIDRLFACGIGEYITLPQLVVVGDQFSGKSSVLEGITNLPFPRDSGLCTRFATQITFRRSQNTSTTVTIIPSKDASEQHVEELRGWKRQMDANLDPKSFLDTMQEACQVSLPCQRQANGSHVHNLMGLGGKGDDQGSTFSEDILKLEVCGPQCQHFSVVDVPGIFRTATKGVTTLEDAAMVKSMVRRYMDNPRSVMLAVIPANVDIATQEILTLAEEADPDGYRTLGVLTKPDLVDPGAESTVMQLVKGEKHPLNLGWCLVRNLGQQQIQENSKSRSSIEKTFFRDTLPWNTLDKDRVGADSLRKRLQEVLASNIRREFLNVKRDVQSKLNTTKRALEQLGGKRQTAEEQRNFILDISMRFQEVVQMALTSSYSGSDWFDEHSSLMFVTAVVNRNEDFNKTVERHGHTFSFKTTPLEGKEPKQETHNDKDNVSKGFSVQVQLRSTTNQADLEELICGDLTMDDKIGENIIEWLTDLYHKSRGFELGTFDKNLLSKTMKSQSVKWESLAHGYILDVIHMAHDFVKDLLRLVCPDDRVREGILNVLMDSLLEKYREALDHANSLLKVERTSTLITLNKYFHECLEKWRQNRLQKTLEMKSWATDSDKGPAVHIHEVVQQQTNFSNAEHTVFELHDILKSYYEVARKRFVDSVCMQAADFHLVTGPENPLKLFSPQFVSSLSAEQLDEIAGEDVASKRKRAALAKEVADMEVRKKILGKAFGALSWTTMASMRWLCTTSYGR